MRNFAQNWQHTIDSLFGGFQLNRHADGERALDISFVVTQRHCDASVRQVELLLGERPVLGADACEFSAHALGVCDGV